MEESRQQAGAQVGVGVVKRIGELDRGVTRVIDADPEGLEILVTDEGQGDELDESGIDNRTQHTTTTLLGLRQTCGSLGGRKNRLDTVEADLAGDLLDVVIRINQVRAPCRRDEAEGIAQSSHLDTRTGQDLDDLLGGHLGAEDTARQLGADGLAGHLGELTDDSQLTDGGTTVLSQQLAGTNRSSVGTHRIDSTLEAARGLRSQFVTSIRPSHRHGIEVSPLEDD